MGFEWEKLGNLFRPDDFSKQTWMAEFAQAPASLVLEDRVRIYFSTRARPDNQMRYVSRTSYVDVRLDDPTKIVKFAEKPVMELGGIGTFDEFGVYPFSAIREDDCILAFYGGWTRCISVPFDVAIGSAISDDGGNSFRRVTRGPILGRSVHEPYIISGPKIRKFNDTYYLFYIAGTKWMRVSNTNVEPQYRIRLATSRDRLIWVREDRNLIDQLAIDDEAQSSPDVFWLDGRYHMLFSYRSMRDYRGGAGSYRIGYAWSDDLIKWNRDDGQAGIGPSNTGWDSGMIAYPHFFESSNDRYLAYHGADFGRHGFGLAKLTSYNKETKFSK